jgi:hypothetical protein
VKWRINRDTREAWTVPPAGLGDTQTVSGEDRQQ